MVKMGKMPRKFELSSTKDTARIEILEPDHLPFVLKLQDDTRAALPEGQKMFVLPQSAAYFENLLARRDGAMVGVWVGDRLIAQMALMGPMTVEDMVDQQRLTRNDIFLHHADQTETAVIAKSMAVHPNWRGNELSQHMLEYGLALPFVRAAAHVFAQISVNNIRSWVLFLQEGFGIIGAGLDPSDRKPRFVMQRPALGFALHPVAGIDGLDAASDFAAIMRLTQREALIGKLDQGEAFKLAFHASEESAAAWTDVAVSGRGS